MPVTRMPALQGEAGSLEFYHEYDCGVLIEAGKTDRLLFVAHKAQPFIMEVTGKNDIIQRELANYALVNVSPA